LELQELPFQLDLGDRCRSLLGYDRHLIAVSQTGTIEVRDAARPASGLRFKADGPITCEPCVENGVLYLGSRGGLSAYSLGSLIRASPRLSPLWQLRLPGLPVQALTAVAGHLYVTVQRPDGTHEVHSIEDLERRPPPSSRSLWRGARPSWTAGDGARREGVFLSQDGASLQLHRIVREGPRAKLLTVPLTAPPPLSGSVPLAFLGGQVFAVCGDDEQLCRIDAAQGELEGTLGDGIQMFSLSRDGERGWDGDGVQVSHHGVRFLRAAQTDALLPQERVKAPPVLVAGRAAVLAMLDGRLRAYDLLHLPRYDPLRLAAPGEEITSLISFQGYLAAGNSRGVVKLLALRERPAAG
jgi:hypothetical protein